MSERGDRVRLARDTPPVLWPVHLEPRRPDPGPLVIMAAPVGGLITREQNPNQPYLPREIADQMRSAFEAGAQIHHLHVRDEYGFGSENMDTYYELHGLVAEECPGVLTSLNLTRPLDNDSVAERFETHDISLGDTVVINLGSMNVGDKVFVNSEGFIVGACRYAEQHGVRPELAVYNHRMLVDLNEVLIHDKFITPPYFVNICMGIHSALPATPENLLSLLPLIPPDAVWILTVGGRDWLPMMALAIGLGGHVRVGMEDNVYMYPWSDEVIADIGECVRKVAAIGEALGRRVATVEETRAILGLDALKAADAAAG